MLITGATRVAACVRFGDDAVAVSVVVAAPVPVAAVEVDSTPSDLAGSRATRAMVGRVGELVRSVRIELADGQAVTASCGQGSLIAWWPSATGVG